LFELVVKVDIVVQELRGLVGYPSLVYILALLGIRIVLGEFLLKNGWSLRHVVVIILTVVIVAIEINVVVFIDVIYIIVVVIVEWVSVVA